MTWFEANLLVILLILPLVGAALLMLFPASEKRAVKNFALFIALFEFILSTRLVIAFDKAVSGMQYEVMASWMPSLNINFHVGIDGISLWLVLMTTLLAPIVVLSAYKAIEERVREYMVSMLILETAMIGAFVALDLVLFYVFWELMLIPMYLLIGVFGGERRIYAAVKFFIFTMVGSLLMLVAILYLYFSYTDPDTGAHTFEILQLYGLKLPYAAQLLCFLAFALAFAIKVPMFPFHTWLPDAHTEAPTGGSVILAAVLLKMGTYGFVRFAMPLFPEAAYSMLYPIAVLSVIGIIYGAWVAMVQPDVKRLIAYSSVSHLGFVMLGLMAANTIGVQGAIYQMLNHGVSTGALFLLVGVIYERRHTRMISDFGGLAKVMPMYAAVMLFVCLSSAGLPPLNGFVGEFLILVGSFTSESLPYAKLFAALAALGVIFSAVYLLWMYRRVFFGRLSKEENMGLTDLSVREWVVFLPLLVLIVAMGVFPQFFLSRMEGSVENFVKDFRARAIVEEGEEEAKVIKLLPELHIADKAKGEDK
ncbi:MAG: NADH-quinone oxidoreductase subunit M [Myxococcota bacterium]